MMCTWLLYTCGMKLGNCVHIEHDPDFLLLFLSCMITSSVQADHSTFFYTGGRRKTCYLAPERFYDPGAAPPSPFAALTPAMDIFAAGCVLAELFLDGQILFEYSDLLRYRQGAPPPGVISALGPRVGALVAHMTQLDPDKRYSAREYLTMFAEAVMDPAVPAVVRPFMAEVLGMDPDARATAVAARYRAVADKLSGSEEEQRQSETEEGSKAALPQNSAAGPGSAGAAAGAAALEGTGAGLSSADKWHAVSVELLAEVRTEAAALNKASQNPPAPRNRARGARPAATSAPPATTAGGQQGAWRHDVVDRGVNDGLVLLLSLLCAVLRGCRHQRVRVRLIHHIADCAVRCGDDECRLQRAVPQLVAAAAESHFPPARCAALRALVQVLSCVRVVPPSDARAFADYVLPSLSLLPLDAEPAVQAGYARVLGALAVQAQRSLEQAQRAGAGWDRTGSSEGEGEGGSTTPAHQQQPPNSISYDEEMGRLRAALGRAAHELLLGQQQRAEPKLALLPQLASLASVLGRRDTSDRLFPPLLTLFNAREWRTKAALYDSLQGVCPILGSEGVERLLLPFADEMLADSEPTAVACAANLFATLCTQGLLGRRYLLNIVIKRGSRLLRSDCASVRAAGVNYLAAAAGTMSRADARALLLPILRSYLAREPKLVEGGHIARELVAAMEPRAFNMTGCKDATAHDSTAEGNNARSMQGAAPMTSYSVHLSPQQLQHGSAWLSCALQQTAESGGGAPRRQPAVETDDEGSWEVSRLVATAQRSMPRPDRPDDQDSRAPSAAAAPSALPAGRGAAKPMASATEPEGGSAGQVAWRPRGVLVADLREHSDRVTRVTGLPGTPLFVSASEDGTAKVWDCRRLERDISFRPRSTIGAGGSGGALLSLAALPGGTAVATGGADGTVRGWNLDVGSRNGPTPSSAWSVDLAAGDVMDLMCCGSDGATLAAATRSGGVLGVDTRAPAGAHAWHLNHLPSDGVVSRMCCDPKGSVWLLTGSTRGVLSLWDLRFCLPVTSWRHPTGASIDALGATDGSGAGVQASGPVAFAAAGPEEVLVWDVATATCKKVLRVVSSSTAGRVGMTGRPGSASGRGSIPSALGAATPDLGGAADPLGRSRQLGVMDLRTLAARPPGVRALLPAAGAGLLTAGTDRAVRLWDCAKIENSYVVVGASPQTDVPSAGSSTALQGSYSARVVKGVEVVEEHGNEAPLAPDSDAGPGGDRVTARAEERVSNLCHQQSVTDMACVQGHAELLLVTAAMDGVVKVWR